MMSQPCKKIQTSANFTNRFTKFTNHTLNIITNFTLLWLLICDLLIQACSIYFGTNVMEVGIKISKLTEKYISS